MPHRRYLGGSKKGRESDKDRVKRWSERVDKASRRYDAWSEKFKTQMLEEYYLGQQWPDGYEDNYVINLFFPSIEIRKPSLYFFNPKAKVEPKPSREDDEGSTLNRRAKLREDILNTLIDDPDLNFQFETQLALHEAHFKFGVVEVGYSADFVENPNLDKPILKEDTEEPMINGRGEPVVDTRDRIPEREQIFVRRIPAANFRVSLVDHNDLQKNDWCGYFEWHHKEDLEKNPGYENNKNLKATGELKKEYWPEYMKKEGEDGVYKDMVMVWKVWDLRTKKRYVFAHGSEEGFLLEDDYDYLPFAALKFHEQLDTWYPMPPTFNWLKIQDELNETREMQRVHRKRAVRKYTYQTGRIDEDQLDQLISGGDMTIVGAEGENPISPVQDAPLDGAVFRNVPQTKEDFIEISGVTGEQRGISEAETATQANILDARTRVRENFSRKQVSDWLGKILWLMLKTVEDNMSLAFPVKISVDPEGPLALQEAMETSFIWGQIQAERLEPLSYDVTVDLEELSPVTEEARRQNWNQVLAILTNEKLMLLLMQSEVMLRKTLSFYGIRNEKEIREIQQVGKQLLQMFLGAGQGGESSDLAGAESPGPPDGSQITNQLIGQVGGLRQ